MFEKITPEAAGIKSASVLKYIKKLNQRGIPMHSVLMMKGDKLFAEYYWSPFDKDTCHRMYSETKSYVAIAIGLLVDEGKLSLDDKIADHFPERIDTELPGELAEQTVREMLSMQTAGNTYSWFSVNDPNLDRVHLYFNHPSRKTGINRPSGTLWGYDSAGSQVLGVLAEKLSGMSLFDYLNKKVFSKLGTFKTATILKTPNGDSWADSALVCTPRDMLSFARFVMNYGTWNGERLLSEEYVRSATSKLVDNTTEMRRYAFKHGYGYQIWKCERDGFAFVGMGNQLTVCLPEDDIIFVCTADSQQEQHIDREVIVTSFFDFIMDEASSTPLAENPEDYARLENELCDMKLYSLSGLDDSPFREELDGAVYTFPKNEMGISEISFKFNGKDLGEFHYTNEQGRKVIPFGVNHNVFGLFPQLGYYNEAGKVPTTDGFMYKDAVSFAWLEEKTALMYIQIIDRYLGSVVVNMSFKDDKIVLAMTKAGEDFLKEYSGYAIGKKK